MAPGWRNIQLICYNYIPDCQGPLERLFRRCQPRLGRDPRHPGSPPVAGGQVARKEDQTPPKIGAQTIPRRREAGKDLRNCLMVKKHCSKISKGMMKVWIKSSSNSNKGLMPLESIIEPNLDLSDYWTSYFHSSLDSLLSKFLVKFSKKLLEVLGKYLIRKVKISLSLSGFGLASKSRRSISSQKCRNRSELTESARISKESRNLWRSRTGKKKIL